MAGKLKKLTTDQVAECVRMYDRGLSLGAIAEFMQVSRQAMWDLLRRRTTMRSQLRYGSDNHFYRGGQIDDDYAHNLVEQAVEDGVLVPQPCESCGANGTMADGRREVQAHHDDYNKPLNVRWLCQRCHHEWHRHNKPKRREVPQEVPAIDVVAGGFPIRAKTSVPPEKEKDLWGNDLPSGSTCDESSRLHDPVGFSLRTSLLSALEAQTGLSLTWKESATPSGRSWWVLGRSARRTRETGSGSSRDWQTPTSADGGSTSRGGARKNELLLGGQVRQWLAPTASEQANRNTRSCPSHGHGHGFTLAGMVGDTWPTPRAEGSEQTGAHSGTPDTLTSAARHTESARPTPNARDWKDSGPTQGNRKSPNLGTMAHWPTPTAGRENTDGQPRDFFGGTDARKFFAEHAGPPDPESPSTTGKPRGCLNSRWVASLMGYPSDWCDVPTSTH